MRLSNADRKRLAEVTSDARKADHKLTAWEKGFLATLETMVARGFGHSDLTPAQAVAFSRLENKIYATG